MLGQGTFDPGRRKVRNSLGRGRFLTTSTPKPLADIAMCRSRMRTDRLSLTNQLYLHFFIVALTGGMNRRKVGRTFLSTRNILLRSTQGNRTSCLDGSPRNLCLRIQPGINLVINHIFHILGITLKKPPQSYLCTRHQR
ncbi:hypothetical protein HanRHA438_Chr17g0817091 [Helianthus annuus]|nr:hypothetical protein HanRHA438_Chr17g0817091 [Helianthus annuus]